MRPQEGINARYLASNLIEPLSLPLKMGPKAYEYFAERFGSEYELRNRITTLTVGGMTPEQMFETAPDFVRTGHAVMRNKIDQIVHSDDFIRHSEKPEEYSIIKFSPSELGIYGQVSLNKVKRIANELGLKLCPQDLGLYLLLDDTASPKDTEELTVVSESIRTDDGAVSLLNPYNFNGVALYARDGSEDAFYEPSIILGFCLPSVVRKK
jgi:hypothetical protein